MQFFYHKDSGANYITLEPKDSHYLFVVRRLKQGATLTTSNLVDMQLYEYIHEKKNIFRLTTTHSPKIQPQAHTHIILAMVDIKDIYDILPMLNALNVASLQLFYADFSQKNRKIDIHKAQRILQYSCMQCGRMKTMELAIHKNLESVCTAFPHAIAIDFAFNTESLQQDCNATQPQIFENLSTDMRHTYATHGIIIGCEGGFSHRERHILHTTRQVYALQIPYILTAHLTSTYIASLCV